MDGTDELVENEWYIVRNSGEIPEIAYNAAIYFLTRAADGPQLILQDAQRGQLLQAAVDRYEEIVLRDLYHENIETPGYRGVARSLCNYERFEQFCKRQKLSPSGLRKTTAELYATFLQIESRRLEVPSNKTVINCSFAQLKGFAVTLGTPFHTEYHIFKSHCPQKP